ncbi:glycosyltransferase family 4 protein [Ponticoccus sp. SC2-23]|uniref:exopolysaccharide biosynthesis GT4 family glycosyltransferase EpsE n=1 Tax=Alexandriicola marinus TaxID=2081710 RepID=UPI000FDAB0E4|nr:exopolysaccharide biosynthesis GT4 family glycosyltransferase EpsE [Alexandriicola marinus]MBM1220413.1 glycosyltransferase family 4 protein [Ponticoccus sp. SC6-9]MBM1225099.1 glycosyltransferase family 4 protein [Ponticoccus sp. SC6-15]MBM1228613.1 glycosyltransferase family 4 protein [Ponticoccus sp. SC6-38]MBM1233750.1 glycosyltransferase family 4 protein [Ponticoccus sp. SC6-45]MBM1239114.1 glycosyltransferase family 4 protein [Ponticoccus sp. SC6-49]MBM1242896.1 glycosyltransferase f
MAAPRKLGYLVPQFPGQTHIFFWREIRELEMRGIEPVLFSTLPPPPGLIAHNWSAEAADRTDYLGRISPLELLAALPALPWRRLIRLGCGEKLQFWKDVMIAAGPARVLAQRCRSEGISHVHAHSCGRAALIAALCHDMDGPPYSLTLHGPLADYGPGQRFKWSGATFATIITRKLIDEMQAEMPDALPQTILLQPMGVDTDRLARDTPYVPAAPGGPLRLFCCARLNVVKGHEDLLAAVRQLRDAGRDVTLRIAGEDDAGGTGYRKTLEARIAELGLGEAVTLLGAIDADAVRDELLSAHIFVLASYGEPLGVAYMEAMSCEVPTIGTDAGGVPELITDGTDGRLVPPRDPNALASAIIEIADAPELALRLSSHGRARVVASFRAGLGAETLIKGAFDDHVSGS